MLSIFTLNNYMKRRQTYNRVTGTVPVTKQKNATKNAFPPAAKFIKLCDTVITPVSLGQLVKRFKGASHLYIKFPHQILFIGIERFLAGSIFRGGT
jgi:hypothetical protein